MVAEFKISIEVSVFANPWIQLVLGIICMVMIANLQYGWTLFVNPIDAKFHWGKRRDPGGVHRSSC